MKRTSRPPTPACAALVLCCLAAVARPASAQTMRRESLPPELARLSDEEVARIARMSPLPAISSDSTNRFADDERAALLGHRLFFDRRISPAGVSCADCHRPANAFTDGRALGEGVGRSVRNTPTVIDAARRRWIGWDGKFDSLWSQALAPIENPDEMGGSRERLLRTVRDDEMLRRMYESVFGAWPAALERAEPDPLADPTETPTETPTDVPHTDQPADPASAPRRGIDGGDAASDGGASDGGGGSSRAAVSVATDPDADRSATSETNRATANVLKALGAYQKKLVSGEAPIDRAVAAWKRGDRADPADLDASALRGLALFVSRAGCYQCHRGPSFTDEEFHNLGFVGANGRVADDSARLSAVDFLKASPWNAAGPFSDAPDSAKGQMVRALRRSGELFGQFRTPPLRGVAATPPYMHDGRLATLREVVGFYDTLEGASPVGHHGESVLVPLGLTDAERADLVRFLESLTGKAPNPEWTGDPKRGEPRTSESRGR